MGSRPHVAAFAKDRVARPVRTAAAGWPVVRNGAILPGNLPQRMVHSLKRHGINFDHNGPAGAGPVEDDDEHVCRIAALPPAGSPPLNRFDSEAANLQMASRRDRVPRRMVDCCGFLRAALRSGRSPRRSQSPSALVPGSLRLIFRAAAVRQSVSEWFSKSPVWLAKDEYGQESVCWESVV